MKLNEQLLKDYREAIYNSQEGHTELLDKFKVEHKEEFNLFSKMYRKRTSIKSTLEVMYDMNEPVYWFTLTFNNKLDLNSVETKRKYACRFLKEIAPIYLMVEEYGEDNGRYHIHGFLVFKYGCGFEDFRKWPSRQKLEEIKEDKCKKKTRYLTNYTCKSVPRIRRSKQLVQFFNYYTKHKKFSECFPNVYEENIRKEFEKALDLF